MSTPAFVEQLYLSFFGRPADAAGRAYWSQALDAGVMTAAEVTHTFLTSPEFVSAVEPVVRLYYSAFNRIPDSAGLAFWLHSARAGLSLGDVANAFAGTQEFAELYGAARNADFVDLIYQNALGRAPDAAGKAFWVAQLASGAASRVDLLAGLAASKELADASSAAIKVIAQYHGITGTAPTPAQLQSALAADQPITLINQLFASSSYVGAPVPHAFVVDAVVTAQGGGATGGAATVTAPVLDLEATTPADDTTVGVSVTPTIVLGFSQQVHAGGAGGMIYITDGAAQTVIDRATGLPRTRIVGATDTRAIDVNDSAHVSFDGGKVTVTVGSALKAGVSYSVLIGKGVLEGDNGVAFGGIAHTGTLNFTPSGDTTAPAVVSFALDRTSIKSGHTSALTIQFSEAVRTLDASAFDVPNGTLTGFTTDNGGRTWHAIFSPTAAQVDDATNVLTLRAGAVRDIAGNPSTAAATSNNYAIDTIIKAVVDSEVDFNDTGISDSDRLTNDATQTLSGRYVGAPSGTTLSVVINGVAHAVDPQPNNTWSYSGGSFVEGLNTVVAYFTNPAGKKSAERILSFTLDTVAPTVTGGLAGSVDAGKELELTFSEGVYWEDDNAEIVFESAGGNVRIKLDDVNASNSHRTLKIGDGHQLVAGTTYTMRLPAALTDAAGNAVAAPVTFTTAGNLPAPQAAVTSLVLSDVTGPAGTEYPITRIATQTLSGTYSGTLGASDKILVWLDNDRVEQATVNANGTWTLANVTLKPGYNEVEASVVNHGGGESDTFTRDYELDTQAAPLAALTLAGIYDSGPLDSDRITGGGAVVFNGQAEALATVNLRDVATGTLLGTATAGIGGAWSIAVASLPEGALRLAATQTDRAGNTSAVGSELAVVVDKTAPGAPVALDLLAGFDLGASPADNITSARLPAFSGAAGTVGDYVKLYADGAEVGSTQVGATGAWQVAPDSALADGALAMTVKFLDVAGNLSAASNTVNITVDTVAPSAPGAIDLLDGSDSGNSIVDNLTNIALPSFGGSGGVAGDYVKLFAGATEIGSSQVAANGSWHATVLSPLAHGAHNITARYMDTAGNLSAASSVLGLTIDTQAPAAPTALDLLAASDSGASLTDNITRDTLPSFTGGAGAVGDTVKLFANGVEVGSSAVAANGSWQVAPGGALADGVQSMTVRFMDSAGNMGAASSALGVTIDTVAPTVLGTTPGNNGFTSDYVRVRFSEEIKFTGGDLKITTVGGVLAHLLNVLQDLSWVIGGAGAGNDSAVLSVLPDVGHGTYKLEIESGTIHDLAGNAFVPLVGVPIVTFQT